MELGEKLLCMRFLSNEALLLGLGQSLRVSRRAVAEVVAYLGEVEERRLHLLGGYSSMFAYCLQRLGMSEDEAYRRMVVARLARSFPRLLERLEGGHVSLSVAALLKARLTDANHEALLAAVSGKTVEQAREVIAAWFPQPDVLPLLRKLPARAEPAAREEVASSVSSVSRLPLANVVDAPAPREALPVCPAAAALTPASKPSTSRRLEPLSPERYKLQLTVRAELKRKLDLACDLLRHGIPSGDHATIIERALDLLIDQAKKRRFGVRPELGRDTLKPAAARPEPSLAKETKAPSSSAPSVPSRHVSNDVRREVYARDGARCTWRGPDGIRCDDRAWLEHDHVIPYGQGGTSDATNIRLFCRQHNRLAAEQAYGQDAIARIIARKRRQRAADRQARSTNEPRGAPVSHPIDAGAR